MSRFLVRPHSLKTGFKYIRRSRFLTLASVFVMSLSFLVFLSFASAFVFSHFLLRSLEDKAQITVFFKTDVAEPTILEIRDTLLKRSEVESVKYVSQNDALKIYLGQHQDEPGLLEAVSANILPASLEIKTRKISSLNSLAAELKARPEVEEVVFFKDVVETLGRWAFILRVVGLALVSAMLLVSLLVVLLSVGISVKIRADEIEIMRLVGASDGQVTSPFIWQGAIYGLFSSAISFIIFAVTLIFTVPYLKFFTQTVTLDHTIYFYLAAVAAFHFLLGPLLGAASSFLGVRKYLRV
ncbi:MAG: permease-like cell division protein FtsX [Patescibacteria group bacterium]|nr:permease-like cell division protein FtsX [Patescibacteria group bacterium]